MQRKDERIEVWQKLKKIFSFAELSCFAASFYYFTLLMLWQLRTVKTS